MALGLPNERILPANIDLTENRDFGGGGSIGGWAIGNVIPLSPVAFMDDTWEDGELITCDQYEYRRRWESIFGVRKHKNQKYEIFDWYERKKNKLKGTGVCQRCGKEVRAPWKMVDDLCLNCHDYMGRRGWERESRIPWNIKGASLERTNAWRDLFDMR